MLLSVNDIHTFYGNIHALHGLSIDVEQGEIVTLIGSNGAGKTTTLGSISGLISMRSGKINFDGKDISGKPAHEIVKMGISLSPEGREVFPELTVSENLRLGAYNIRDMVRVEQNFERVYDLFPRLKERTKQQAGTLSGGEQQMLAIGRALMSEPKLLMLDEPSLGLAPMIVDLIFEIILDINKNGITILLVEQNANMALSIANRGYVLESGKIKLQGLSKDLSSNDEVKRAYLGG
ncbi:MAG: ABC transporter ATP-binding protein [Clostridia bacterium]